MSSLTDRYVHAATRRLPDAQRIDVARELETGIGDRVDSMLAEQPQLSSEEAERRALMEMGDPDRLAADFAGAPQQLIGGDLYPSYVRVLKSVTLVAVPAVTGLLALIDSLSGTSVGNVLGGAVWTAFTLTVQIAFWVTLIFAIMERTGASEETRASLGAGDWSPDQLAELPKGSRAALVETMSNVAWLAFLAGAICWQQLASPFHADGEQVPILDPALWSFWIPLILSGLALEMVFEVVKYRAGGIWTTGFATINMIVGLLFALPVIYLAQSDKLLNPEAVSLIQADWAGFDPGTVNTIVIVGAILIWVWDSFEGWRKTQRGL